MSTETGTRVLPGAQAPSDGALAFALRDLGVHARQGTLSAAWTR